MKKLDLYILKKFLVTYFFVVLMLMLVITVIDITEKMEDFMKNELSAGFVLVEYYFAFIPYMANLLSPITIFIATIFVTANLAARTEIIAMLSSGMSLMRIMYPFLIGSIIIGLLVFYMAGWLIPQGNKSRIEFEKKYIKSTYYFSGKNVHIKTSPTTYVYLESYNSMMDIGYQFTLEKVVGNKLVSKLKAGRIHWIDSIQKWHMDQYFIRSFDNNGMESIQYGKEKDTILTITPKDFEDTYMLFETFNMQELEHQIDELKARGAENIDTYIVEKYQRYTYPFSVIILTLIGVIAASRKSREGAGLPIAFGFLLAFVYIIFMITSRSLANVGGIGPLLASWIPNLVFIVIGTVMYRYVPK
ncbi:LptF/LptG family permease [uncultured Cytophaga sp.]|uniref:LptF/LptG family permease n=1 Tax=uncultured Cytophaga sp. TaxID=160238 RepID=UPI00260DA13A|nr:LptF/LptG family permease [uncultured Cytophaga sp.]